MNLWKRVIERRQHKAHERYLRERDRQQALQGTDVEEEMRRVATNSNANMQGGSFQ
jgi:hypothetical protein